MPTTLPRTEAPTSTGLSFRLASLTASLGVVLILASLLWPLLFPTRGDWSDDQAKALSHASAKNHRLQFEAAETASHSHKHGPAKARDPALVRRERDAAQEDLQRQLAELHAAQTAGQSTIRLLRWLGIAAAAAGAVGILIWREPG